MYRRCITTIVENSGGAKCHFFVAIERNSSPAWVRSFYDNCGDPRKQDNYKGKLSKRNCEFFFYADVYPGRKISYGYVLGNHKKIIFAQTIKYLNLYCGSKFVIADTTEYGKYMDGVCSLEHLVKEIKNYQYKDRKFTGKINATSTDDVLTCLIMSVSLGTGGQNQAQIRIANLKEESRKNCTPPWLSANCRCPLVVSRK